VDKADQSLVELAARIEEQQAQVSQEMPGPEKIFDVLNRRQASARTNTRWCPTTALQARCAARFISSAPPGDSVFFRRRNRQSGDLEGFADNYNPLLTGTQSLVRFWARRRRKLAGI